MSTLRILLITASLTGTVATDANWTSLSPANGNRSITTFDNAIYVAAPPQGVRQSVDDGVTWTYVNTGLPVAPDGTGRVFAYSVGHTETALFCGTQSGVYRSTDHGANWESVDSGTLPSSSASVYCKKIYTFGTGLFLLYSGTVEDNGGGIFRSYDNGNTWLSGWSGLSLNMTLYNITEYNGALYVSTSTGLMRSSDHGGAWQSVVSTNWAVRAVAGNDNALVILGALGAQRSVDNGQTWTSATGYPTTNCPEGSELVAFDGKFFAITKTTTSGCYRSLDNGATWQAFNTGFDELSTLAQQQFHATAEQLYMTCLPSVFRTPALGTAVQEGQGLSPIALFPTVFDDHFNIGLDKVQGDLTVMLLDATGRVALQKGVSGGGLRVIERTSLVAGRYHCMLFDPRTGSMQGLGQVVAQ
ncbi:MAG: exo-alpha-sialidase [Flavobacteriales bacterium]|nr:exo-alpha-sialidase [Flavobacteriales bacterium]